MKNQYVGDIGDYGKYALLQAFADAGGKVGVNWYLTDDDRTNDGKFTDYLKDARMSCYNPGIFDALKKIAYRENKSVADIRESGILPGVVYYDKKLLVSGNPKERKEAREKWFEDSLLALTNAELIFMDPDNGLLKSGDASMRGAEKYILPEEAERYFRSGHDVVYYCHKGRRSEEEWRSYLGLMFKRIPEAEPAVLTYHKGTQRSYVFLIHKEHFVKYREIINGFWGRWDPLFTEEPMGEK